MNRRVRDDCFALPPGVDWTPVDEALALLRERLDCVTGTEEVALADAAGRVLAADAIARRPTCRGTTTRPSTATPSPGPR